jgi:hypothetical protein
MTQSEAIEELIHFFDNDDYETIQSGDSQNIQHLLKQKNLNPICLEELILWVLDPHSISTEYRSVAIQGISLHVADRLKKLLQDTAPDQELSKLIENPDELDSDTKADLQELFEREDFFPFHDMLTHLVELRDQNKPATSEAEVDGENVLLALIHDPCFSTLYLLNHLNRIINPSIIPDRSCAEH